MVDTSMSSAAPSDKVFSLAGKNLKLTTEEDIAPYLDQIRAIDGLREIHLGGNTLGVGACQALGKVLQEQKQLEVADFADIFTGRLITEIPDALRALCDSLVAHESLREMDLSDNAFGGRSAEPMVNFLTHNHHFSILKLNNNGLGVTGGQIVANALLAAAEELDKHGKVSQLKTVICGRNRLEDGSAPVWAKAYAAHKTLEEVRMFQNGIRMDGIVALAQGLAACANLKVLDLQDNTATVQGSRGIAASLAKWPELEVLNLSDCLLKPKGGLLVLNALHNGSNTKLNTLQLQYCDLDRKALERLASALDSGALKNVSKLEINGNWADEEDECVDKIKAALEKNGHEDALDELDEMDPEGEDDEVDEADEDEDADAEEPVEEAKQDSEGGQEDSAARAAAAPAHTDESVAALATALQAQTLTAGGPTDELKQSTRNVAEDKEAAQTADEVAEVAKQVPEAASTEPTDAAPDHEMKDVAAVAAVAENKEAAETAAEVADVAEQVPETSQEAPIALAAQEEKEEVAAAVEDKKTAETAAEVAEVAEQVPETSQDAPAAHADSGSAQIEDSVAGVSTAKGKEAAETADEVSEVAKQVPESSAVTSSVHADAAPTQAEEIVAEPSAVPQSNTVGGHAHTKSVSVDLTGELYGAEGAQSSNGAQASAAASGPTTANAAPTADEANATAPAEDDKKNKRKSVFRGAVGAIRELLRY